MKFEGENRSWLVGAAGDSSTTVVQKLGGIPRNCQLEKGCFHRARGLPSKHFDLSPQGAGAGKSVDALHTSWSADLTAGNAGDENDCVSCWDLADLE
jgi:hypothetical protein